MPRVLLSPVCDLLSDSQDIETQVLFGERVFLHNNRHYAYSQLFFSSFWQPYPGASLKERPLFSSQNPSPNAIICSQEAFLEPWHIPLPFASPLHINTVNQVVLSPESIAALNVFSKSHFVEGFCHTKNFRFLDAPFSSEDLVNLAEQLITTPYVWGGRCIHTHLPRNGVDCSGFVQLLYQAMGRNIPRNARDQFKDCFPIKNFSCLPIGGLIFLKKASTGQIDHVMMKTAENQFIHASEKCGMVEKVSLGDDCFFSGHQLYFGKKIREAVFGMPKNRKAFF